MIKRISKQEESKIPQFSSHKEAQQYFVSKYGRAFVPMENYFVNAEEERYCYRYFLVLNRGVFEEGQRSLKQETPVDREKFLRSYQLIEITYDGKVDIAH